MHPGAYEFGNHAPFRFLRVRPRKILLRPLHPHPHALIFRQGFVSPPHHRFQIAGVARNHHRTRLGIPIPFDSHHNAVLHLGLAEQRCLQIAGMYVRPARRDNDFLLAAFEVQIAGRVQRSDVTCAIPALLVGNAVRPRRVPISRRYSCTLDENLPVFCQLHLASRQNLPDRALPQPEWTWFP